MADREEATREVRTTEEQVGNTTVERQTVSESAAAPSGLVAQRIVWYVVGVILALLAIRVVLLLLGANKGNGFVDFVYSLSSVFAAPFYGIFSYEPSYGISTLEISSLVAMAVYALVGWGLAKLFTLGSNRADV
jgi:hypothetical protein